MKNILMYLSPSLKAARAILAGLSLAGALGACSKPPAPPDPRKVSMEKAFQAAQTELAGIEEKLKNANDSGTKDYLGEQKELIKSRLERIKELGGGGGAAEAKGGGGGHH